MKRWWANFLIVGFLGIIIVDSFPFPNRIVDSAKDQIDPIIDVLGIWQGTWDLFAPSVDRENHRIVVRYEVKAESGSSEWMSPDWKELNSVEKFIHSRDIEFFDRIRSDRNSPAWLSFAQYMKAAFEADRSPDDPKVSRIEIGEVGESIPPPEGVDESGSSIRNDQIRVFFRQNFSEHQVPGDD